MLTGKEEKPSRLTRSNRGNQESEQLPKYLRSTFTETFTMMEPQRIKIGKKQLPQYAFGNSIESPSFFKLPNSLVCKESYNNPFLNQRTKPKCKWETIRSSTLNNYDFYNVMEQRFSNLPQMGLKKTKLVNIITNQQKLVQTPEIKPEEHTFQTAYKTLQSTSLFGRKRELFTDFIDHNDNQNVYGNLNDRQRPKGKFRDIKNFTLSPQQVDLLRKQKSTVMSFMAQSPINKSNQKGKLHFPKAKTDHLERYFKHDQEVHNQLSNSIIISQIDSKIKHPKQQIYNSDIIRQEYQDNEKELIEVFEKHLEFEKQYL